MIAERLQQQKVDNFSWACQAFCLICCPVTAHVMFNLLTGRPRNTTDLQDCMLLTFHTVSAVALVCPGVISWRTIDFFYSALALSMSVAISPWACRRGSLTTVIMAVNFAMIILCMVRRAALVVVLHNFVLAIVASCTIMVQGSQLISPIIIVILQVAFLAVLPACAYVLEASTRASVRQEIEMQATKDMLSAASALLRICYEVVVELDSEGAIQGPARALASFLFRGPLQDGARLSELISHDEDRERFLAKLRAPPQSGEDWVEPVKVRMRDGVGNTLRLELFLFDFRHADGGRRHMVGLRELSDGAPDVITQERQPLAAGGRDRGGRPAVSSSDQETPSSSWMASPSGGGALDAPMPAELHTGNLPRTTSFSSSEGGRTLDELTPSMVRQSSTSSSGGRTWDEPTPMVVLNASRPGLPLLACSTGFGARVGSLPQGALFRDHVRRSRDFYAWLHAAALAVNDGRHAPACRIVLRVRQGRVEAACRLTVGVPGQLDNMGGSLDSRHICLVLSEVKRCTQGASDRPGGTGAQPQGQLRGTPIGRMGL